MTFCNNYDMIFYNNNDMTFCNNNDNNTKIMKQLKGKSQTMTKHKHRVCEHIINQSS